MGYNRVDPASGILQFGVQQVYEKLYSTVLAASTNAVDILETSTFISADYTIVLFNRIQNKSKSLKMIARTLGSTAHNQVFGRSGDPINVAIDTVLVGLNMEVQIINNESYDLDCIIVRAFL
jgi:hypothetical protein